MNNFLGRIREETEWCRMFIPKANDSTLPRVLLIGDSVTEGSYLLMQKKLEGIANVALLATSKGINDIGLIKETLYMLDEYEYDIIRFNNGLHGWHITDEEYKIGLTSYIQLLKQKAYTSKLLFATTTPVTVNGNPNQLCEGKNPVVLRRNAIASEIMSQYNIKIHDLYSLVLNKSELRNNDGYHYNQLGNQVLSDSTTETIKKLL